MEHARVIRSAFTVGSFTLMSRTLGLVRDFLTAGFFGTSPALSAFVVAFRIPNLFRALFGEGALSSAFIPVFASTREKEGEAAAWALARRMFSLAAVVLLAIVLLGEAGLTAAIRYADLSERFARILPLARVMLPYMLLICMTALFSAVLNAYHKFILPAATPCLLNLTWIVFLLALAPRWGVTLDEQIYAVAWGVFVAGLIQWGAQWPALMRLGYRPGFTLDWSDRRVVKVFALMGPAAMGLAVYQVNALIDSLLAAWAGTWAPAALFYAERLLYFPQGLLATAMSTVLLPVLSKHAAAENRAEIQATMLHALRTLFFVMAAAAAGLFALADPIVRAIFEWGRFGEQSTLLTTRALMFYAPGLLVFGLGKVFVPAFYAMHDTRTPVKIGLLCVGVNLTLNILFVTTWPTYWKHAGLALATVLSEALNGFLLIRAMRKRLGHLDLRSFRTTALRALPAAAVMAVASGWTARRVAQAAAGLGEKPAQIVAVAAGVLLGVAIYFGLAALFRFPEIGFVREALQRRRRKPSA